MAIEYSVLTKEERDLAIARALHAREVEHFHYSLNAQNYANLLAGMTGVPDEWPENLRHLKGRSRDDIVRMAATPADTQLALAIAEKDRLKHLLVTEQYERDRVETYHARLLQSFASDADRAAALAALRTALAAEQQARRTP